MEPIKVGDLVMVVRPACCQNEFQGFPFTVRGFERMARTCKVCGKEHDTLFALTGRKERPYMAAVFTLMKIDPPPIKTDERQPEELTA